MSNLLKMSYALEDDHLNKRVHAAVILRAQQVQTHDNEQGDFAKLILSDPKRRWDDFIIRVASDNDVQDAIALAPDNSSIYATNVTDKQIQDLVASELTHAARRIMPQDEQPAT
jgi:hypothetical protein